MFHNHPRVACCCCRIRSLNYRAYIQEMASAKDGQVTLPPFFPLVLPKCKSVAETFFECFDAKPLQECTALLKQYEICMIKNGIQDKIKLIRVPDLYKKENQ
jgi:hypothetical protein